jgi:hypothetical protein
MDDAKKIAQIQEKMERSIRTTNAIFKAREIQLLGLKKKITDIANQSKEFKNEVMEQKLEKINKELKTMKKERLVYDSNISKYIDELIKKLREIEKILSST